MKLLISSNKFIWIVLCHVHLNLYFKGPPFDTQHTKAHFRKSLCSLNFICFLAFWLNEILSIQLGRARRLFGTTGPTEALKSNVSSLLTIQYASVQLMWFVYCIHIVKNQLFNFFYTFISNLLCRGGRH